jgi:hypothetical protein
MADRYFCGRSRDAPYPVVYEDELLHGSHVVDEEGPGRPSGTS